MLTVIVVYSVINVIIQSVIQPKFVGDAVGLSVTFTFLSLVFWAWILGPLGAILAIPLTLMAKALLIDIDPSTRWVNTILSSAPTPPAPVPCPLPTATREGRIMTPDFSDTTDFENADRGFVDRLDPCIVTSGDGRVVWDMEAYAFLDGDCPDTAHPSLWRQAQLCAKHGLYEVTEGIYQVRGLDLSNMTIVEGDTGVIVIDPLISAETAAAALALYRTHRGDRPVTGVIYTHSHADHFGGVDGVCRTGRRRPDPRARRASWSTRSPRTSTPARR